LKILKEFLFYPFEVFLLD